MYLKRPVCLVLTASIVLTVCGYSSGASVKSAPAVTMVGVSGSGTYAKASDSTGADGSADDTSGNDSQGAVRSATDADTSDGNIAGSGSSGSVSGASKSSEENTAVSTRTRAASVIIAVDGQDELLRHYGLWYVGQSTGSKLYDDGSEESMAELAALGVRGWVAIRGGGYKYIDEDGTVLRDTFFDVDDCTYRFDAAGWMVTGWWSPDEEKGQWYYFYEEGNDAGMPAGAMASDTQIDGYELNEYGIYSEMDPVVAEILDREGWNLKAAYNYSASLKYYRFNADPDMGVEWFADYGFSRGYGNCYVMAATFCVLARALGYEAYQMAGYVPKKGGGITPHSWCELIIGGETRVFDPNYTNETGGDAYNIYYGKSGSWQYQSYYRMHD